MAARDQNGVKIFQVGIFNRLRKSISKVGNDFRNNGFDAYFGDISKAYLYRRFNLVNVLP